MVDTVPNKIYILTIVNSVGTVEVTKAFEYYHMALNYLYKDALEANEGLYFFNKYSGRFFDLADYNCIQDDDDAYDLDWEFDFYISYVEIELRG